jgi:putative sterol carrier protein
MSVASSKKVTLSSHEAAMLNRITLARPLQESKVDATVCLNEATLAQICMGKLTPQTAFMKGKMKVKGERLEVAALCSSLQWSCFALSAIQEQFMIAIIHSVQL